MNPPQVPQFLIVRGLEADADPVKARLAVQGQLIVKKGAGIYFNGNRQTASITWQINSGSSTEGVPPPTKIVTA